jgi:hypothetical protein
MVEDAVRDEKWGLLLFVLWLAKKKNAGYGHKNRV